MAVRVHLREGDRSVIAEVSGGTITLGEPSRSYEARELTDGRWQIQPPATTGEATGEACVASAGDVVWVLLEGELFEIHVDASGEATGPRARGRDGLASPMPATVVRVLAQPGVRVARGDTLVVLEAMKMELSIRAPHDGLVQAVHCTEGQLVQPGVALVDLD
jgi:3-methylcrotonyl-CoA carboxylase alpha subunit